MKAIFNNKIIEDALIQLDIDDRLFQYGDGYFETARCEYGRVRLMNYHYERIITSARMLEYDLPAFFSSHYLEEKIDQLFILNDLKKTGKIKIKIWRQTGKGYVPTSRDINFLITAEPLNNKMKSIERVSFSTTVTNHFSKWSFIKSSSALSYVMAGIEKQQKNLDEIVILDDKGNISELLQSNILWIKNGTIYTPSVSTGCVQGVMRSYLLDKFTRKNMPVVEGEFKKPALLDADHVLSCNALGIVSVNSIDSTNYASFRGMDQLNP